MRIEACGATHKGNVRKHNEDNIYVDGVFRNDISKDNVIIRGKREEGPHAFAVFDGIGGEACGERASYITSAGLKAMEDRGTASDVETFVSTCHRAILNEAVRKDARNMGTTAVVLLIDGSRADVHNVGDSRAYLFRDGTLTQLSKDHTVLQSMIDGGFAEEAANIEKKRAGELTQYIGMYSEEDIEPAAFSTSLQLMAGDRLLLCSDGLTGELADEDIQGILAGHPDDHADYLVGRLVKAAVDGKCKDNVSALVVRVD